MKHVLSIESIDLKASTVNNGKIKNGNKTSAPIQEDDMSSDDEEEDNILSEETIIITAKKSVINAICAGISRELARTNKKASPSLNGSLSSKKVLLDPSKSVMFHKKTTVRPITVINNDKSISGSVPSNPAGKFITRMKLRAEVDSSLDREEY